MLFASYIIKPIQEVEIDGEDQSGGEQSTDYTADAGGSSETQTPVEQNQDQNDNQETQPEAQDDGQEDADGEEEPTDYTAMGDDGERNDEGGGEDDGANEGDSTPVQSDEETPVDDIKKQEEELYANLTPQQLDIKHEELKNQYLAMFDMVNSIIERIGDTSTSEENIPVIEYVSKQLADLQSMIADYMNFSYKTKSYIENSINYNRFIAVLNGINKILEEMNKKDTE